MLKRRKGIGFQVRVFALVVLFGLNVLNVLAVGAQEATLEVLKLDLEKCIDLALQKRPDLQRVSAQIELARAQLKQARSLYWPHISSSSSFTRLDRDKVSTTPIDTSLRTPLVGAYSTILLERDYKTWAATTPWNPANPLVPPFTDYQSWIASIGGFPGLAALQAAKLAQAESTFPTSTSTPVMGKEVFTQTVDFKQSLFTWGKITSLNRQAKLGVDIANKQREKTKIEIIFSVTEAYNGVLLTKDLVRVGKEIQARMRALLSIAESAYKGGVKGVTKLDWLKIKLYLARTDGDVITAEKGLDLALAALKTAIGVDWEMPIEVIDEGLNYEKLDIELSNAVADAKRNRAELMMAAHSIAINDLEVKVAKASFFPMIGGFGRYTYLDDNPHYYSLAKDEWMVGVAAEWPLFDGFSNVAELSKARAKVTEARALKSALEQVIVLEVTEKYLSFRENWDKINIAEEAVKVAIENRELARESYEIGSIEIKDVLEAQLLEAMTNQLYYETIYNYNLNIANLAKAMGIERLRPIRK